MRVLAAILLFILATSLITLVNTWEIIPVEAVVAKKQPEISDPRVKIIDFEGKATSAIVNEKEKKVYVTDSLGGKLHIFNAETDELEDSIDVVPTPFGVGVNPNTGMIYVVGEHSNILSVINAKTKTVEVNIPLKDPYDISVNPNNNMVYVTSDRSGSVYVIDGSTHEIVTSFEVPVPCGIAVNPDTGIVYVTSESEEVVYVFDGNENKVITRIPVESSPRGVTTNPVTNMIYVTNQESNTLSVIDGSTNTVIDSVPVGETPRRVIANPQLNIIYVTNQYSSDISVIDGKNNKTIETIVVAEPYEITINTQTNKVYSMYYGSKLSIISGTAKSLEIIESPLKQFSSGIDLDSIVCKEGLDLIYKASDNSPACVKPSTVEKLIQRGWANEY